MALLAFSLALCTSALMPQDVVGAAPTQPQQTANGLVMMRVAATAAEPLLGYLVRRFETGTVSSLGKRACTTRPIDEHRVSWFFDDAQMSLLDAGAQAQLVIRSLPDGKPLDTSVQLQLGPTQETIREGLDVFAIARADGPMRLESCFDVKSRAAATARFSQHNLDLASLSTSMRIDLKVVGIAIGDQVGDVLHLTVRRLSCREADLELLWHEFHAEAIASADQESFDAAVELRDVLIAELAAQQARLQRETNGEYQRAFARAQAATWLPLALLHKTGVRAIDAKIAAVLATAALCAIVASSLAVGRLRRASAARSA